jgi:hypothetical protein
VQRAHCGCKRREVVTAAGTVTLRRVYYRCSRCTQGGYALDERLGIQGRYSPDARRLICLAGGSWSYDVAAAHLRELSGLVVSDTTVRELCQAEGALMAVWQRTAPAVRAEFAAAEGEVEFTTDGTMVNTTDGWQEMKLGLFAKRPRGDAATPDEWDERDLPKPTARVGFAAIEASDRFGARWDQWAARLGVKDTSTITVLADGAKWIWDEARRNLIGSAGVLDVYHALEHVHAAAKTLFGGPGADGAVGARLDRHRGPPATHPPARRSHSTPGAAGAAELPGESRLAPALRRTSGGRPLDRQRPGGRRLQKPDRPPAQTDRSPLARPPRQSYGEPLLPRLQPRLETLLGSSSHLITQKSAPAPVSSGCGR